MLFYIFYTVFFVCSTIYTVQDFGLFLTPRQFTAVIMFFLCLIKEKKLWYDKFIILYCGFILIFGISSLVYGYENVFFKRLIGDYFVAYIAYWATRHVVINHRLKFLLIPLFVTIGFNAIVSYYQLIGNDFFQPFLDYFHLINDERFYFYQEQDISLMGKVTFGIYSSPVVSGHMLMYASVLSIVFQKEKTNYLAFILTIILLVGGFATQERTGFYVSVIFVLYLIYKWINYNRARAKKMISVLYVFLIMLVVPLFFDFIMAGSSRYAIAGLDLTGRDEIYEDSFLFYLDYPFIGNYFGYMSSHRYPPHNMLLSSLLYSGILGTLFILIIICLQFKILVRLVLHYKKYPFSFLVFCFSYASIIINGLTHNLSIVNGDINGWIIWGALYYQFLDIKKQNELK